MVEAALAEQPVMHDVVDIQLVEEGVAVLRDWSREHDHLVQLAHPLHELVDAWTLDDINIVVVAFDLDRYCEVRLVKYLEEHC